MYDPKVSIKVFKIKTLGPNINVSIARNAQSSMFVFDKILIPLSSPLIAEYINIIVILTTVIIIVVLFFGIPNK